MMRLVGRFGRSLRLNGVDEYAHLADGDITGSLEPTADLTFACFVRVGYAATGKRMIIAAKRNDGDAAADAGWLLERTADNTIRLLIDDGSAQVELETSSDPADNELLMDVMPAAHEIGPIPQAPDDFYHLIVVTFDVTNDTVSLWFSPGRIPWYARKVATASLSTLTMANVTNAHNFALGAVYNGTTAAHFWEGSFAWATFWSTVLTDEYILEPVARFQYPPDHYKLVSKWWFGELTLNDWNRVQANDLVAVGIDEANYDVGPERFLKTDDYSIRPSVNERAGSISVGCGRFRPQEQSEGHFYQIGNAQAPPLRVRRTTLGAGDEPAYPLDTAALCTIIGKYAVAANRLAGGMEFRLYDTTTIDYGADETTIWGWEPVGADPDIPGAEGKITDNDYRSPADTWCGDDPGNPQYLFGFAGGTSPSTTSKFIVTDITDPTAPSKLATLGISSIQGISQLLWDARDNDTVWMYAATTGKVYGVDVSTRNSPSIADTITNSHLLSGGRFFVQVGARLYIPVDRGISVINIATLGAATYVARIEQASTEDIQAIAVLDPKHIATISRPQAGSGRLHVWRLDDPDAPEEVFTGALDTDLTNAYKIMRRGSVLFVFGLQDGDSYLQAYSIVDVDNPRKLARYDLSSWLSGMSGASTRLDLDRDTLFFSSSAGRDHNGFFKLDDGAGVSNLSIDYEAPAVQFTDPRAPMELSKLLHDLSAFSFEDDDPDDPPTGWTKSTDGDAGSTALVSDDFGLTGQLPGSGVAAQSLKLLIGGTDTFVDIDFDLTPAGADLNPGAQYMLEAWYRVEGDTSSWDPAADLRFTVSESGGVSTDSRSTFAEHEETGKWFRVEMIYELAYADSTGLTVAVRLLNSATATIYLDAVRFGPARIPRVFAGRIESVASQGVQANGAAIGYSCEMVDWTYDLNRLDVDPDPIAADTVATTIPAVLASFARSKDGFTANNVYAELGSHPAIDPDDKLGKLITQIMDGRDGIWFVDHYKDIWAIPQAFFVAPIGINDVVWGVLRTFADATSVADLVTAGTINGDQSRSNPVASVWSSADAEVRYGAVQINIDSNADIATTDDGTAAADALRALLGDVNAKFTVSIRNEPRLRPGQIIPVQIDLRGIDRIYPITGCSFASAGAAIVASLTCDLLEENFFDVVLRQREKANQKGKVFFRHEKLNADAWAD